MSNVHHKKEHQHVPCQWLPPFCPSRRPFLRAHRPWVRTLLDEVDLSVGALDDAILHIPGEHLLKALELGDGVSVAPFRSSSILDAGVCPQTPRGVEDPSHGPLLPMGRSVSSPDSCRGS